MWSTTERISRLVRHLNSRHGCEASSGWTWRDLVDMHNALHAGEELDHDHEETATSTRTIERGAI